MRFVYSDRYKLDIGAHVFQTEKYAMVRDNLLTTNQAVPTDFVEPPEPDIEDIRLVHTKEYVDDMLNLRWSPRTVHSELPLTSEVVQGFMLFASGTVAACRLALEDKVAMHIGGGFHHAFADHGEGFCYINDIAIGIRKMQQEKRIERAAVIDWDLHQGNGTARIFQGDPSVYTFSIHQERLYPVKEKSNLDIGLDDEAGDDIYTEQLQGVVGKILALHKPELVVYVAGADPYKYDQLGALRLTKRGLAYRDRIVIEGCYKRGIPVVPVTAGGYALDPKDTAEIHTNTARECLRVLGQLKPTVKPDEPSAPAAPSGPEQQPS
jgi:acetoin utilization deacetylase AcuC-like enzyme